MFSSPFPKKLFVFIISGLAFLSKIGERNENEGKYEPGFAEINMKLVQLLQFIFVGEMLIKMYFPLNFLGYYQIGVF